MARQDWVRVSAEQAQRHPLFGLGGWLRLVSLMLALTAIAGPLITVAVAAKVLALPPAMLPAGLVLIALLALGTAIAIGMAVLWFNRAPHFLSAYAELSAFSILLDFTADLLLQQWGPLPPPYGNETSTPFTDMVVSAVVSAVPWVLLWHSRRYRVTFRHEVRRNDPILFGR
jgi:hypothetical protein